MDSILHEIMIKKMIVHILDNNLQLPIMSEEEHPLEEDVHEFMKKHIIKILRSDDLKNAIFINDINGIKQLCEKLAIESDNFKNISVRIASMLFNLMVKHIDIPSSDLVFSLINVDYINYLSIIKFNYTDSFIHNVYSTGSTHINSIIKQKTTLPSESHKIDEAIIINLDNLDIKLIEKKYEINGEKSFYISTMLLGCSSDLSNFEKVKIFNRATKQFKDDFLDGDMLKSNEIKKAIIKSIREKEVIDVNEVAETAFYSNPDLKTAFIEKIEKSGIKDKSIIISEKINEKKYTKQKIETDTGIEINLPYQYYDNKDKIEFINNKDGTISILIKNVGKISDKF